MTTDPGAPYCTHCLRTPHQTEIVWNVPDHECIAYHVCGNCDATSMIIEGIEERYRDYFDWATGHAVRAEINRRRARERFTGPVGAADAGQPAMRNWHVTARLRLLAPVLHLGPDMAVTFPFDLGTIVTAEQYGSTGKPIDTAFHTSRDAGTAVAIPYDPGCVEVLDIVEAIAPRFTPRAAPRPT